MSGDAKYISLYYSLVHQGASDFYKEIIKGKAYFPPPGPPAPYFSPENSSLSRGRRKGRSGLLFPGQKMRPGATGDSFYSPP